MKPGGTDLSKMNPSMVTPLGGMVGSGAMGRGPRDRDIGLTVCVIKGPHKGYVGTIKDTNGPIARVELRTGNKVITLDKTKIRERLYVAPCFLALAALIYVVSDQVGSLLSSRVVVPVLIWAHQEGMVAALLILPIPTTPGHEHLPGASAARPTLMAAMPAHHHTTHRLALRTRTQMEGKHPRGMHHHGRQTHIPMVGRLQLGMRTQRRRIPIPVVVGALVVGRDGVEPHLAGWFQRQADGEVRRRRLVLVCGVVMTVGVTTLGYVTFSFCFVVNE